MGAKDSLRSSLRRPGIKCDMCPKKFLSPQALSNHIHCSHKNKPKGKDKKPPTVLNTLLGKSVKSLEVAKKSEDRSLASELETDVPTKDIRKIEYECPQCCQCFSVYFSAFRHIQKYHCIDSTGAKVPRNSLDMIKPVRIEVCLKCNQRLRANDLHSCTDMSSSFNATASFICTGCSQQFSSLKLFNMHVTGLHCGDVETLFFPNRDAFTLWKEDVESQAKVKYLILDSVSSAKQIYHCTHMDSSDSNEDNVVNFCPSSIFVRDFTKSVQVHFYKQHFGHDSKYMLPEKFDKYKMSQLLKAPAPITEPYELNSLHMDFKTLMNFLVIESVKCDKATLEILQKKAQEMLTIINTWDEPTKTSKRNMTDDQISETLESLDSKRQKLDTPAVNADIKPDTESPVIVNAFSLRTNSNEGQTKRILRNSKEPPPVNFALNSSPSSSKSSFNDSYREFVDKNFKPKPESEDTKPTGTVKSIETVKEAKISPKNFKSSIINESIEIPTVKKDVNKVNTSKNKKKIKTKIGQFRPSIIPRKREDVIVKDQRRSLNKVDFEYEVREQENDCNILVLKF